MKCTAGKLAKLSIQHLKIKCSCFSSTKCVVLIAFCTTVNIIILHVPSKLIKQTYTVLMYIQEHGVKFSFLSGNNNNQY